MAVALALLAALVVLVDMATWLAAHEEDHTGAAADLNQYWYSADTIDALLDVVREHGLGAEPNGNAQLDVAFVSTPSLFFGLSEKERRNCRVLDYDEGLGDDVIKYDFNEPTNVPDELRGAFRCAVIDPPFITADVWKKYAETAKLLLRPGGLVVLTTVIENAPLLAELFSGVRPRVWLPSIPNLPYQYAAYTNFDAPRLSKPNPEVPHDPDAFLASASRDFGEQSSRDDERPIQASGAGPGGAYDFDDMVRRAEAEEEARRAAAA